LQALNGTLTPFAGSTVGFCSKNIVKSASFCMPVVKGTDFQVDLTPRKFYKIPTGSLFWISIDLSHRMRPPAFYKANEWNQTHTSGILTGFLSQPPTQRYFPPTYIAWPNILAIQTAPTQDFANPKTVGVATVQNSDTGNVTIQYN